MTLRICLTTAAASLASMTNAYAHAGDHTAIASANLFSHVFASPFHAAGVLLASGATVAGIAFLARRFASQHRRQ